jgi:hypothetical protein
MQIGPIVITKAKLHPFHAEITRLIKENPDYLEGIEKGIVHLAYDPGQKPKREEA